MEQRLRSGDINALMGTGGMQQAQNQQTVKDQVEFYKYQIKNGNDCYESGNRDYGRVLWTNKYKNIEKLQILYFQNKGKDGWAYENPTVLYNFQ